MGNAEIFIEKFIKLDHYFEYLLKGMKSSFIEKKEKLKYIGDYKHTVRRYDEELEVINRLRNVVAHENVLNGIPIADPREDIISLLDEIFDAFARPMTVLERKSGVAPIIFSDREPVTRALKYMGANDFSQVVVEKKGRYGFLKREDIAVWMESLADSARLPVLSEVAIGEIMREDRHRKCHVPKNATVYKALAMFQEEDQGYPALMITENGKDYEKPLGILTPMDLIDYLKVAGPPEY